MKNKHNKKRNTAFVFESLLREMSRSIITKEDDKKKAVIGVLKEFFSKGKVLEKELQCYQALMPKDQLDRYTAEKMIHRAKISHASLDEKAIFEAQSKLIKKINTELGSSVFSNFVPNYKDFATIAQIFNDSTPVGKKVILENKVLDTLTENKKTEEDRGLKSINSLVVKSFINKFNKTYKQLLPEQKNLLSKYVQSFGDNDADFRVAVGNELHRIHESVKSSLDMEDISSDQEMVESTKKVLAKIEAFNVSSIDEKALKSILKLQDLVREYSNDASED